MAKPVVSNMGEKVCLNHPNTQAVSRCTSCFKPLCRACVVMRKEMDFCSELCAASHFATSQSLNEFESKLARERRLRKIKSAIGLLLFAGVLFGGWYCWKHNIAGFGDLVNNLIAKFR